jgi:hypothetical protein
MLTTVCLQYVEFSILLRTHNKMQRYTIFFITINVPHNLMFF